jgi:hypothetical protein
MIQNVGISEFSSVNFIQIYCFIYCSYPIQVGTEVVCSEFLIDCICNHDIKFWIAIYQIVLQHQITY